MEYQEELMLIYKQERDELKEVSRRRRRQRRARGRGHEPRVGRAVARAQLDVPVDAHAARRVLHPLYIMPWRHGEASRIDTAANYR